MARRDRVTVRWRAAAKRWLVALEGVVLGGYATKREAIAFGRRQGRYHWEVAGPTELVIYAMNGRICRRESYGKDPPRFKG